jgi:hypothetical protein
MRTESFHADDLAQALRRSKIATMPELKKALPTAEEATARAAAPGRKRFKTPSALLSV